jgi:AcrR family transcriptional regulator
MARKTESRIIEAAITLFADYGYFGVTIRDLAREARTTEGTVYRLMKNRDGVFDQALLTVIHRSLDPAQLLLMLFESREKQDLASAIASVVRRWYAALPEQSARFLMQAYWSQNARWREMAFGPIQKLVQVLGGALEREVKKEQVKKFDTTAAARTLILALFQFKLTSPAKPGKQETEAVDAIIGQWLQGAAYAL